MKGDERKAPLSKIEAVLIDTHVKILKSHSEDAEQDFHEVRYHRNVDGLFET
jgi:hypothetical protein